MQEDKSGNDLVEVMVFDSPRINFLKSGGCLEIDVGGPTFEKIIDSLLWRARKKSCLIYHNIFIIVYFL